MRKNVAILAEKNNTFLTASQKIALSTYKTVFRIGT